MSKWEHATISAYVEPKDSVWWFKCRKCHERPRVWRFDNGCHAKCCCGYKYDPAPARSESVMSHVRRHDGSLVGYDGDALRMAWNRWIETGKRQDQLPEGQW